MPKAAKTVAQQFAADGKQVGGVAVFLYEMSTDRDVAYRLVAKGMGESDPVADVGDKAIVTRPLEAATKLGLNLADLLFHRCSAIAHVRMTGASDRDAVVAYARRLDKRLQKAVCP